MIHRRHLDAAILVLSLAVAGLALAGCRAQSGAQPLPASSTVESHFEPTRAITPAVPTATPTGTATPSPTATETPTATTVPTDTPTPEPTATATPSTPPLPTPDGVARQVRVPILMYHYLSDPPPDADKYRRDLSVSPALFEQHLAYLKEQGYQSITLYDLLDHLAQGRPLPRKPVILTFDDGYRDNYENALPLLQKYGFTGTFFVLTEVTNQGAPDYMTWDQLRAMAAAGMDVECHARVHEELTQNDDARLVWQVLGCHEAIEAELGKRPRFVAYPSGVFDDRVASFFASDHYWGGISTQQGALHTSDHLFDLKRLRVRNTTTVAMLAELLAFPQ